MKPEKFNDLSLLGEKLNQRNNQEDSKEQMVNLPERKVKKNIDSMIINTIIVNQNADKDGRPEKEKKDINNSLIRYKEILPIFDKLIYRKLPKNERGFPVFPNNYFTGLTKTELISDLSTFRKAGDHQNAELIESIIIKIEKAEEQAYRIAAGPTKKITHYNTRYPAGIAPNSENGYSPKEKKPTRVYNNPEAINSLKQEQKTVSENNGEFRKLVEEQNEARRNEIALRKKKESPEYALAVQAKTDAENAIQEYKKNNSSTDNVESVEEWKKERGATGESKYFDKNGTQISKEEFDRRNNENAEDIKPLENITENLDTHSPELGVVKKSVVDSTEVKDTKAPASIEKNTEAEFEKKIDNLRELAKKHGKTFVIKKDGKSITINGAKEASLEKINAEIEHAKKLGLDASLKNTENKSIKKPPQDLLDSVTDSLKKEEKNDFDEEAFNKNASELLNGTNNDNQPNKVFYPKKSEKELLEDKKVGQIKNALKNFILNDGRTEEQMNDSSFVSAAEKKLLERKTKKNIFSKAWRYLTAQQSNKSLQNKYREVKGFLNKDTRDLSERERNLLKSISLKDIIDTSSADEKKKNAFSIKQAQIEKLESRQMDLETNWFSKYRLWITNPDNRKKMTSKVRFSVGITAITGGAALGAVAARFAGAVIAGEGLRYLYKNKIADNYQQKMLDFRNEHMVGKEDGVNREYLKSLKDGTLDAQSGKLIRSQNTKEKIAYGVGGLGGALSASGLMEMANDGEFLDPFKRFATAPKRIYDTLIGDTTINPDAISGANVPTPEIIEQPNGISKDIFINKGEGITHALQRQINASEELRKALGVKGDTATGNELAAIAKRFGYINADGSDVRVFAGEGAGYELKIVDKIPTLIEHKGGSIEGDFYTGGHESDIQGHHVLDQKFEGSDIEHKYEYISDNQKPVTIESPESSVMYDAPLDIDVTENSSAHFDAPLDIEVKDAPLDIVVDNSNQENLNIQEVQQELPKPSTENIYQHREVVRQESPVYRRRGSLFSGFFRNIFGVHSTDAYYNNASRYGNWGGYAPQGRSVPTANVNQYYNSIGRSSGGTSTRGLGGGYNPGGSR